MSEYITMYLVKRLSASKLELLSKAFDNVRDADSFAEVFKHNYKAIVNTVTTYESGKYAVIAQVEERLIRSNYQADVAAYVFANWKFNHR